MALNVGTPLVNNLINRHQSTHQFNGGCTLTQQPREVQIRVIFLRIGEIDTLNEKFYAEILIESKWEEKKLRYEYHGLTNTFEKDLNDCSNTKYWNPCIYVENGVKLDKSVKYIARKEAARVSANTVVDPLRFTYWMYEYQTIKGSFFEKLELTHFPVDVQNLSVHLTTYKSIKEVKFIEMYSKLSLVKHCTLDKHIWHLYEHVDVTVDNSDDDSSLNTNQLTLDEKVDEEDVESVGVKQKTALHSFFKSFPSVKRSATCYFRQFYKLKLKDYKSGDTIKHPLIEFKCKAARKSGYYYWNAFLLIFLITSVVFTTFSIDLDKPFYRLPTTATLLLTSVTFRWMYSCRCLPTVDYLTSLDKYSLISLLFVYITCIWHGSISGIMTHFNLKFEDLIAVDKYMCLTLIILYLTVQLVLIIWLRRGYLVRQSLRQQDIDYHKRLVTLHYRTSFYDKCTDDYSYYETNFASNARLLQQQQQQQNEQPSPTHLSSSTEDKFEGSSSPNSDKQENKLKFYLTNETAYDDKF